MLHIFVDENQTSDIVHRALPFIMFMAYTFIGVVGSVAQNSFVFMEMNAENLFDPIDDPQSEDDAFLPNAPRAWTWKKFRRKVNNLSKVIAAAGGDKQPDAIALCEVENDSVLVYLTKRSVLRKLRYEYIITHSDDVRGMNVAFLYNPMTFKVLYTETMHPDFHGLPRKKTRDILHVAGMVLTGDTLDVFVCHFPSRLDKRKQGKTFRMRLTEQLKGTIDTLFAVRQNANIIITGDFNDTPTDEVLMRSLQAEPVTANPQNPQHDRLYNLMNGKTARHDIDGTYYFKGRWEILDNFIVSGRLLSKNSRFYTSYDACRILDTDFLLTETEGKYMPLQTYKGYKYVGGFSDHLPVVVRFGYSW